MSDMVDALQDVERAVERVEQAIKNNGLSSFLTPLAWTFLGIWLISELPSDIWHSKWRYAFQHQVNVNKVYVRNKPHDCDFFAAPLGGKFCHYEQNVSTVRWAKSTLGESIVSLDEGKTWNTFTPDAGVKVPQYSTVEEVYASWEKKED